MRTSYALTRPTHLCHDRFAEALQDLGQPFKCNRVKSLSSSSVSFESAIITWTCESEQHTGERSAEVDRAMGYGRASSKGHGCVSLTSLVGDEKHNPTEHCVNNIV